MADYIPSIGLEVHAELSTRTKVFCGCANRAGAPPNTQVCPICLGFPGVLPMLNREVVNCALQVALAFDCHISRPTIFERKATITPIFPRTSRSPRSGPPSARMAPSR